MLAHIASSSLAHVWGGKHDWAHVALFEKRHIAESQSDVTKHTAGASPTAFYLINQLWEDRKKRKKNKKIKNVHRQRALTQEHTPTAGNPQKLQYMRAHTHTPFNTANLISSGRYSYTHANTRINHKLFFFSFSLANKNTPSHTHATDTYTAHAESVRLPGRLTPL